MAKFGKTHKFEENCIASRDFILLSKNVNVVNLCIT